MRIRFLIGMLILLIVGINYSLIPLGYGQLRAQQVGELYRIEGTSFNPPASSVIKVSETPVRRAIPIRGVTIKGIHATGELCINGEVWSRSKFVQKAKGMGVNWVQLVLWVLVTDDGKLIEFTRSVPDPSGFSSIEELLEESRKTVELMISLIQYLHQNGFKVFLITYHERLGAHHKYGAGLKIDVDAFLNKCAEIALKWARIAEENGVEMFAPRKELQMFVGNKKALEWDDKILPKLRRVYHGILVRGAFKLYDWDEKRKIVIPAEDLPRNMSGWDYLGLDLYGNRIDTFDEWAAYINRFALKAYELKEKYGLKGIVFEELGYPHSGEEAFWQNESLTGNDVIQRLYQVVFEECAGIIDGFFPWLWVEGTHELVPGRREYISPNKIIKQYYTASAIPRSYEDVLPAREYAPPEIIVNKTKIILKEDFEVNTVQGLEGHNFEVVNGVLRVKGGCVSTKDHFQNFVFKFKIKMLSGSLGIGFRDSEVGWYEIRIDPMTHISLIRHEPPSQGVIVREVNSLVEYDEWYVFTIIAMDNGFQLLVDDEEVLDYIDSTPLPEGGICLHAEHGDIIIDELIIEEILEGTCTVEYKPSFWLSNLTISPIKVQLGEPVKITINVTNIGELSGSYTVRLKVANVTVDTKTVMLAAGKSTIAMFEWAGEEPGMYEVNIAWLRGTLTVLRPAEFKVTNLSISPVVVKVMENVTISVNITNLGEVEDAYTVSLKINGETEGFKNITLAGGNSTIVSFEIKKDIPGTYEVEVDGLTGTFTVREPLQILPHTILAIICIRKRVAYLTLK